MTSGNLKPTKIPAQVDYTNLDYESIINIMYDLIPQITSIWTDFFDSDQGIVLLQLYAYCADILSYMADRNYNENLIEYAQLRRSVIALCRLIDYELSGAFPANATVWCKISPQTADKVMDMFRCSTEPTDTSPRIEFESTDTPKTINYMNFLGMFGYEASAFSVNYNEAADNPNTTFQPVVTPDDNDMMYFGFEHRFDKLTFRMDTFGAYYTGKYQFWNGTAWSDLTVVDDTEDEEGNKFASNGDVEFNIKDMTSWTKNTVNSIEAYWIRFVYEKIVGGGYVSPVFRTIIMRNGYLYEDFAVLQAVSVDPEVFSSNGEPSQFFKLLNPSAVDLKVFVDEGNGFIEYSSVENFIDAGPDDRNYYIQRDENDYTTIWFGDNSNGKIPPVGTDNIYVDYKIGGGAVEVGEEKITKVTFGGTMIEEVWNPTPALGGEDAETIEDAKLNAGKALRTGWRCVTLEDYETLGAKQDGIGKVKAIAQYSGGDYWNQISCYALDPSGVILSDDAKARLVAFYDERKTVGYAVVVKDPAPVLVNVTMDVYVKDNFLKASVEDAVSLVVEDFFSFKNIEFGKDVYLGNFYHAIDSVDGVDHAKITRFYRADGTIQVDDVDIAESPVLEIAQKGTISITYYGGN